MIENDIPPGSCLVNLKERKLRKKLSEAEQKSNKFTCFAFVLAPGCKQYLGDVMIMCTLFTDGSYAVTEERTKDLRQFWAFMHET